MVVCAAAVFMANTGGDRAVEPIRIAALAFQLQGAVGDAVAMGDQFVDPVLYQMGPADRHVVDDDMCREHP